MPLLRFDNSACDPTRAAESWWEVSADPLPQLPALDGEQRCEVAVVGGGYTGLSCALHLARDHGMDVCVLEAGQPGGGASGRNGGFCCIGGAGIGYAKMIRRYGLAQTRRVFRIQLQAIELVRTLAKGENINLQSTGRGEYQLAHRRSAVKELETEQTLLREQFGYETVIHGPEELAQMGMSGPAFHGALHNPAGFGIHPLRYARGLATAATRQGTRIMANSPVLEWHRQGDRHVLRTPQGSISATKIVIATNGYTQRGLTPALDGNLMPVFSNIIVTRPLTETELDAQGWTNHEMAYDSRRLLHYFRLLPDRRFLFGGRGGATYSVAAQKKRRPILIRDFQRMFPAWQTVDITHFWYGMLCLAADRMPHIGNLPEQPRIFFSLAYHGNGVAMGSWMGHALAKVVSGSPIDLPEAVHRPPPDFFLPFLRPLYLKSAYLAYGLKDRLS